jgi:hypothetical protein
MIYISETHAIIPSCADQCNLLQVVEEACTNLLPNVLCEYLYNLSEMFTKFYTNCQVHFFYYLHPPRQLLDHTWYSSVLTFFCRSDNKFSSLLN